MKENIMIISIMSYYANQIFNGTKKYEFRKSALKECDLNKKIYVYSAKGEKTIVGSFRVKKVHCGDIDHILTVTGYDKRKDKNEIIDYFMNNNKCYALELYDVKRNSKKITLNELRKVDKNVSMPQYYSYVKVGTPLYDLINSID